MEACLVKTMPSKRLTKEFSDKFSIYGVEVLHYISIFFWCVCVWGGGGI